VGAARLGLKSALLSRVGDEHMGRFVARAVVREGVDVTGLGTDPARLTALVILGIRDPHDISAHFLSRELRPTWRWRSATSMRVSSPRPAPLL